MTPLAACMMELMAAGLAGDALVAAVSRIEATMIAVKTLTPRQAANKRYYEKTKPSEKRLNPSETSESDTPPSPPPSPSSPPHPPNNPLPLPLPSSSLRSESVKSDWPKDFREQFWTQYPRKVGKKAAIRKLEMVRSAGEIGFTEFISAVRRVTADDPKFIPHPKTWLNEGRYLDGRTPASTGPPTDRPAYLQAPPGAQSYDEIMASLKGSNNGTGCGTEVRGDAGLGQNGADRPQELQLSGGGARGDQVERPRRHSPDDQAG